jgi:hypothetical protein
LYRGALRPSFRSDTGELSLGSPLSTIFVKVASLQLHIISPRAPHRKILRVEKHFELYPSLTTWDGVVVDKQILQKTERVRYGNKVRTVPYGSYVLKVKRDDGKIFTHSVRENHSSSITTRSARGSDTTKAFLTTKSTTNPKILGFTQSCTFTNCSGETQLTVTSSDRTGLGGFVGGSNSSSFEDCDLTATTSNPTRPHYVGGPIAEGKGSNEEIKLIVKNNYVRISLSPSTPAYTQRVPLIAQYNDYVVFEQNDAEWEQQP